MENYYSTEFALLREKHYLQKNPTRAITLALNYLEDFLNLARDYRSLKQKYKSVMADNQRLTSQLIEMSSDHSNVKSIASKRSNFHIRVRIPSFFNCQRH